jgi:hypothetical protein
MNDFKEGDEIWFFWHHKTSENFWGSEECGVFPKDLELEKATIVYMNENEDTVHAYVRGYRWGLVQFGYTFKEHYMFKSKQDAINTMINQLKRLEKE